MQETQHYFNREATGWSRKYQRDGFFRERLDTVLGWLENEAFPQTGEPLRILDFGCGSGVFMQALLAQGYAVTGVDQSEGMIDAAEAQLQAEYAGRYALEHIGPESRDEGQYRHQQYHAVLCMGVLEYVDDPGEMLGLLSQLLMPGGVLMLSVPNAASRLRRLEAFIHRHPGVFGAFPKLRHLTGPNAYLNFQKHQFRLEGLDRLLMPLALTRRQYRFHVAPRWLGRGANSAAWGMTLIAAYRRQG